MYTGHEWFFKVLLKGLHITDSHFETKREILALHNEMMRCLTSFLLVRSFSTKTLKIYILYSISRYKRNSKTQFFPINDSGVSTQQLREFLGNHARDPVSLTPGISLTCRYKGQTTHHKRTL
jgi:hypothetical protein